jgi:hypothetical protein
MVVPAQAQAELSLAMDLGHERTLTQSINPIPAPGSSTTSRPSTYSLAAILAITDEASPLALRSTRNRLRAAMHRSAQSQAVKSRRDDAPTFGHG